MHCVTIFLKLISFHHVMHDVRGLVRRAANAKKEDQKLTLNTNEGTIFGVPKDIFEIALTYPKCLSISHFIRFMFAPTCCY